MLTIFNRKEFTITYSMKQQADIREVLETNRIDYSIKTINRNSPSAFSDSRARTWTFGQNMDMAYEYIVYVNKNDFKFAKELISGKYRQVTYP